MKTIIAISVLTFVICSAFNEPNKLTIDYRDVYLGTYSCKKYTERFGLDMKKNVLDTGRVNVLITKDTQDSVVQINLGSETIKAKLINKILQPYPSVSRQYGGKFFGTNDFDLFYTPSKVISIRYVGKKI